MSEKVVEFQHWTVEKPYPSVVEYAAPSTGGTITVRPSGISFAGNLTNLTGDEQREVPEVFKAAAKEHAEFERERAQRRAAAERAALPVEKMPEAKK